MPTLHKIAIVLLAAGQSRRMACDKLHLELPNGKSLLQDRLEMIRNTGLPAFVVLRDADQIGQLLASEAQVTALPHPDAALGLGHSLAHASRVIGPPDSALLVMLADLPELTVEDLRKVVQSFDGHRVCRGSGADGKPGHPVLLPARLRGRISTLSGDAGARDLLATEDVLEVPLPGDHATIDLDTRADFEKWSKRQR